MLATLDTEIALHELTTRLDRHDRGAVATARQAIRNLRAVRAIVKGESR